MQQAINSTIADLLAGVVWTPGSIEMEFDAGYAIEFDESPSSPG
jgi:hypothetical protein